MALFRRTVLSVETLEQLEEIIDSGQPVLVACTHRGDASFQAINPLLRSLGRQYGRSAKIVKVDTELVRGAADTFQVRKVPTFSVLKDLDLAPNEQAPGPLDRALPPLWQTDGPVERLRLEVVLEQHGATKA